MNPLTGKRYSKQYYETRKKLGHLPMYNDVIIDEFKSKLLNNDVLILKSTTGSGKSIVSPIHALQLFNYESMIVITQPRTINIVKNAEIIAKQLDVKLGMEVGYKYGAGNAFKPGVTKVLVVIDTIYNRILKLLQDQDEEAKLKFERIKILRKDIEFMANKPHVIMIDEFHERSMSIDLIMSYAYNYFTTVSKENRQYKFVLLSATIDTERYYKYFERSGASVDTMIVKTKPHPIKYMWLHKSIFSDNYRKYEGILIKKMIEKISYIVGKSAKNNVLIFMPTVSMCRKGVDKCEEWAKKNGRFKDIYITLLDRKTDIHVKNFIIEGNQVDPISGKELKIDITEANAWKKFFGTDDPKGRGRFKQKVIFSTPISETGITIEKLTHVIDSGKQNYVYFDDTSRRKYQDISETSRASVSQRCGRSGRLGPGVCMLMYTESEYCDTDLFAMDIIPKIKQTTYYNFIIPMLKIYEDLHKCIEVIQNLPTPMNHLLLNDTIQDLYNWGIIFNGKLSRYGNLVTNLGIDFNYGRVLIMAIELDIIRHMLPIVLMMHIDPKPGSWDYSEKIISRNKFGAFFIFYKLWVKLKREMINPNRKAMWARNKSQFLKKLYRWCSKLDYNYMAFDRFIKLITKTQRRLHEATRGTDKKIIIHNRVDIQFKLFDKMRYIFMKVFDRNRIYYDDSMKKYYIKDHMKKITYIDSRTERNILGIISYGGTKPRILGYFSVIWRAKDNTPIFSGVYVIG